jgi:hypothetical protein
MSAWKFPGRAREVQDRSGAAGATTVILLVFLASTAQVRGLVSWMGAWIWRRLPSWLTTWIHETSSWLLSLFQFLQ